MKDDTQIPTTDVVRCFNSEMKKLRDENTLIIQDHAAILFQHDDIRSDHKKMDKSLVNLTEKTIESSMKIRELENRMGADSVRNERNYEKLQEQITKSEERNGVFQAAVRENHIAVTKTLAKIGGVALVLKVLFGSLIGGTLLILGRHFISQ